MHAMLAVCVLAGLGSCGSTSRSEGGAADRPESGLDLPSDWLATDHGVEAPPLTAVVVQLGADLQALENGADVLAAECMAEAGFDYEPAVVPVDRGANPFGAGDLDPARTAAEGYGEIVGGSPLGSSGTSLDDYVRSLSAARQAEFDLAFEGTEREEIGVEGGGYTVPVGGCQGDGRRAVGGDAFIEWSSARSVLEEAVGAASAAVEDSDAWQDAESRWSACMAEDGYHYESANGAIGDALARFATVEGGEGSNRTVSQEEIDMASTDARCRIEARFSETISEVQGPLERRAMSELEGPILAWMGTRDAVLADAEAALRTGPEG